MATNANWTVVFEDKIIIKNMLKELEGVYKLMMMLFGINLNFQIFGLFNMEHLILLMTVEYRDETPHSSLGRCQLGDFQDLYIDGTQLT